MTLCRIRLLLVAETTPGFDLSPTCVKDYGNFDDSIILRVFIIVRVYHLGDMIMIIFEFLPRMKTNA